MVKELDYIIAFLRPLTILQGFPVSRNRDVNVRQSLHDVNSTKEGKLDKTEKRQYIGIFLVCTKRGKRRRKGCSNVIRRRDKRERNVVREKGGGGGGGGRGGKRRDERRKSRRGIEDRDVNHNM